MSTLLRDLRYGVRMMVRSPGFTAIAVLTLALGIGATTTIFSFVDAVLLKPLPYPDSQRLVVASSLLRGESWRVSPGDFLEWQARNHSFQEMAAFTYGQYNLTSGGEPLSAFAGVMSARFAETAGVMPQLGHTFATVEEADRDRTVIISDHLWRRRFHADPTVVGQPITLDGTPFTVVGVMPPAFSFPPDLAGFGGARTLPAVDLWVPLTLRPGDRANAYLQVVARLKPGVTIDQARGDMTAIARALGDRVPRDRDTDVRIVSLHDQIVHGVRPLLLTLFGAVGLLLLIACANVANLLLGRATAREREVAIRRALGSGTARLIQQYLTESLLLGVGGGAAGLLVAIWGLDLVTTLIPPGSVPRIAEVRIDSRVIVFSAAISLVTGLVFGAAPALHARGTDVTVALKGGSSTLAARPRYLRVLVVAQVTLAFVLVAGAGLLFRSFDRLTSVDPGFKPGSILTLDVTLPEGSYPTSVEMRAFSSAVLERIRNTPGVVQAGAVNLLPIGGSLLMGDFTVEGVPELPKGLIAMKPAVSPAYFRTMGIPLVRGRDFDPRDTAQAPGVAIVTERLARHVWPGRDAIGKRLRLGFGRPEEEPWYTVVGVVGDVKQSALADETRPAIYVSLTQAPRPFLLREMTFVVRTASDPRSLAPLIREQIRLVDPMLPVGRIATMTHIIADSVSEPRFRAVLLGGFAASALVLIAVGMLGVLAYFVARRTREIGVRMALGADRVDVVGLVVRQALAMTGVGVAAGTALALAVTRLLETFLFNVSPRDPATFVATAAVLGTLTLIASYIPARRATRVDPLVALRAE